MQAAGTLSALKSPNFRLYFGGQLISSAGTWMQNIAQAYLVFQLTHSPLWLGLVACAAGLPLILLSPVSGVIIERTPRRQLMLVTQTVQMILAFILAALTFGHVVQVWHVIVLAFLLGVTNALDTPARQAIVFEMVGRDVLQSGIALNSILNSASRVLGPAAAGIALVQVGAAWCFLLNGVSFLFVIASLAMMQVPYAIKRPPSENALAQLRKGLSLTRHDERIAPLLLLTASVGFFTLPILQVYAAFASESLHSPANGYATLSVGQGIGSVLAGVVVTALANRLGRGRLIAVMIGLVGLTALCTAAAPALAKAPPFDVLLDHFVSGALYPLAPLAGAIILLTSTFSALNGLFAVCEVVTVNTLIQFVVPDEFRGRVLALYTLAFFGLSPFGALALGSISDVITTANGIALWGICGLVSSALILRRWPKLMGER
jgi:MFS family permease